MKKKVLLAICLILLTFSLTTFFPIGEVDPHPEMDVFLISNDIHVGIIVPVVSRVIDWKEFINVDSFSGPVKKMEWLEFGWGDRRFFFEMPTWDRFKLELAIDALFSPDPAVMHVSLLSGNPKQYENVKKVKISYKTYRKMVQAIQSWFVLKNDRPVVILGKGYGPEDNFFEGKGYFSIIRTCNLWTADILRDSGLRHPLWSPTKYGLEFVWR